MFSTKQLTDRNSNSVKAARKQYCKEQLEDTCRLEKIFIDECGFNFHLHRTRGRSIVGPNAVITMRTQRGLNQSLIAATSKSGLIHYRTVVKGINSELFQSFLGEVSSLIGEENPASFIFDNCRSHLNATGLFQNHHTKRLPPYSPFLNPIEEMFSFLKTHIRSKLAAHSDFHLQLNSSAKIEWLRN